jgi:uncharacterized C2H2 Zn-finger protein
MPKKNYKQSQDHIIKRLQVQSLKLKDYSNYIHCNFCKKRFKNLKTYRKHISEVHPDNKEVLQYPKIIENIIKKFKIKVFYNIQEEYIIENNLKKYGKFEEYDCFYIDIPMFETKKELGIFENGYTEWLETFDSIIRKNLKNSKYVCFITNEKYKKDMLNICFRFNFNLIEEIIIGKKFLEILIFS